MVSSASSAKAACCPDDSMHLRQLLALDSWKNGCLPSAVHSAAAAAASAIAKEESEEEASEEEEDAAKQGWARRRRTAARP